MRTENYAAVIEKVGKMVRNEHRAISEPIPSSERIKFSSFRALARGERRQAARSSPQRPRSAPQEALDCDERQIIAIAARAERPKRNQTNCKSAQRQMKSSKRTENTFGS